jgi:cytochrome c-type protein NapC
VTQSTPGAAGSWWSRLWTPSKRKWMLGIPLGAIVFFLAGILVYAGGTAVLHASSTTHFCAYACHEFEAFVTPSWQQSVHHKNPKGLQAGCPDCHLPKAVVPMLIRKAESAKEIWGHLTGKIATQEKFDAHKLEMAQRVWRVMKETDSRECRGCHSAERWDLSAQDSSARNKHERMQELGKTCIDCHKGVAHELPPDES